MRWKRPEKITPGDIKIYPIERKDDIPAGSSVKVIVLASGFCSCCFKEPYGNGELFAYPDAGNIESWSSSEFSGENWVSDTFNHFHKQLTRTEPAIKVKITKHFFQ